MKKTMVLLLANIFCINTFGSEKLSCHINSLNGEVTLEKEFNYEGHSQHFVAHIGWETMNDPYKFRTMCKNLKKHIGTQVIEDWVDYGCDGLLGRQRKIFIFTLSSQGKQLFAGRPQIGFYPIEPINDVFLRTQEDFSCDPL